MLALDAILVIAEISAFTLLIGLLINAIYDFNEERKSDEEYSSMMDEKETNNQII
jgi:hypothetical protein